MKQFLLTLLSGRWFRRQEPVLVKAQPITKREFRSEPAHYTSQLNKPKDETIMTDQVRREQLERLVRWQLAQATSRQKRQAH